MNIIDKNGFKLDKNKFLTLINYTIANSIKIHLIMNYIKIKYFQFYKNIDDNIKKINI